MKPVEEWWKLYKQGLSTFRIAEKYGVVQDKVRDALIKAGYELRIGNTQYDLPWDDILSMYENKDVPDKMILKRKYERFENYFNDKAVIEYGRRKGLWDS